ncbi:MAG: tetratricopeptide repeat protein [Verrucomicrobia bacterium]|nr:tetratricopeptide repeat protein [Verrucomicrobiota bacterium]
MRKKVRAIKRERVSDKSVDAALKKYFDAAVRGEKRTHQSNLEPFAEYERQLREKMTHAFRFFQRSFSNGYRVLVTELHIQAVKIDPEKLKIFDDPKALIKALEAGNSIYQLLGFTEDTLNAFYKVARQLIETRAFAKARDVCYFLTIIAPEISQFWICLGRCDVALGSFDTAMHLFLKAIDVDPTDPLAYLDAINLLVQMHDYQRAINLCNAAIRFAKDHTAASWSKQLRDSLEHKLKQIFALF